MGAALVDRTPSGATLCFSQAMACQLERCSFFRRNAAASRAFACTSRCAVNLLQSTSRDTLATRLMLRASWRFTSAACMKLQGRPLTFAPEPQGT